MSAPEFLHWARIADHRSTYEHTLHTTAPARAVFDCFQDIATWPEWDASLERMELDGPFASGTTGRMLMRDQDPLPTRLAWVEDGRGFEDETEIPGTGVLVRVRHMLTDLDTGGTRITYSVTIDGPAADALGPKIGPSITADFPQTMAALAARAEAAVGARWRR